LVADLNSTGPTTFNLLLLCRVTASARVFHFLIPPPLLSDDRALKKLAWHSGPIVEKSERRVLWDKNTGAAILETRAK
jgi:hypothetical protein